MPVIIIERNTILNQIGMTLFIILHLFGNYFVAVSFSLRKMVARTTRYKTVETKTRGHIRERWTFVKKVAN